jgi:hypothetical protein
MPWWIWMAVPMAVGGIGLFAYDFFTRKKASPNARRRSKTNPRRLRPNWGGQDKDGNYQRSAAEYRGFAARYVMEVNEAGAWWPQDSSDNLTHAKEGARNYASGFRLPARVVDRKTLRQVYRTVPKGGSSRQH